MSTQSAGQVPLVASPDELGPGTVLGICASMKPAPGSGNRSAVRGLLGWGLARLGANYPDVRLLDLRDHPLPWFDGRTPDRHPDPELAFVRACVDRAGALLLGVPGYWCGVSGVFKNFVDVLCGPAYDLPPPWRTVFHGKPAGILAVGADDASARAATEQARQILSSAGALVVEPTAVTANPRNEQGLSAEVQRDLVAVAATVARAAVERMRRD